MVKNKEWLNEVFEEQIKLQLQIKNKTEIGELTDIVDMYGAATGAIIEIGEMLQADTRWKKYVTGSMKEPTYSTINFLEEFADVFIYLMNVLIYSGHTIEAAKEIINCKMKINKERFKK